MTNFINRHFTGRNLTLAMYIVGTLWIVAQIVVITVFWGKPQYSDSAHYLGLALKSFENDSWYPSATNLHDGYIFAPGLVNYLILQLKLFGTFDLNAIFNLVMNIGIAMEVFLIGKNFFGKKTAMIAIVFWCTMYSNLMIVAPAITEILFLFLALSGLCLSLHPKCWTLFLAGIILVLANWVRPLAIFFLLSVLLYMLLKKYKWYYFATLFAAIFASVFTIGALTERRIGNFIYQSTTSGVNLIMTSNDKAYGGVASNLSSDSTSLVYIKDAEEYTFLEKDSIWKHRAIGWIKKHPAKYAMLYVKKVPGLYVEDSWSDRFSIDGKGGFVSNYAIAGKVSKNNFITEMTWRALKSLIYYLVLLVFCYSIFVHRKKWLSSKGILLFLIVITTLGTCVFSVSPRYHYPMMFAIVLIAAYGAEYFIEKCKKPIRVES
jgi:uncharacterized membrane protein YhaH (DUF805 family)